MRVEFGDIAELCKELEYRSENIHEGLVRFRVDYQPVSEIATDVGVWITALVHTDKGDYVIEFGQHCGTDYRDQQTGTAQAELWKSNLFSVCEAHGLTIRGGKIELF